MKQGDFEVDHLAELARMGLRADERARFQGELEKVLEYVRQLQAVKTDGVEETAQVTGLVNVLRPDQPVGTSLEALKQRREQLLAAVPEVDRNLVKIPAIFGEE